MRLKDVINILTIYDIKKCDFVQNLIVSKKKKDDFGYCDHESKTIYIDKNLALSTMRRAIIHELIHAWLEIKGIPDPEDPVEEIENAVYKTCYPIEKLIDD
jgi:Zn-dependent peptidase ImmA (M78 family)